MGSLLLIRRSSSSSSTKRLALTALSHFFYEKSSAVSSHATISPNIRAFATGTAFSNPSPVFESARGFHSGLALRAGFAVADYSDAEERRASSGSADDGLEISKLGISQDIVSALAGRGIDKLFPIQRAVLEPAMQGRDMIGRARTGTGKTLAFGIPIMDKIIKFNEKHGQGRNPLAIILAPTRELARQVDKEFAESAPRLDTLCVYGGVPISRQMSTLDRGVDVIVGTPGRVIDLIKRGALNLSEVQFVVLDEADQMLNVGFADDVETILGYITQKHQTMMFSATMPSWIETYSEVGESDQKLADGISLYAITSDMREKPAIIGPLITVIHYELPNSTEIFVHRSGRTGRAGKKGSAILIYSSHQFREVKAIEREVGCRFTELPKVAVKDGDLDMYGMEQGGRFGSGGNRGGGRFGDSGFGRSGGLSDSRGGRFGGYGNSGGGRFGGPGSGGGYGNSGGGRFGGSSSAGGFGGQGSGRSGNFGGFGSGRSGGFGDLGGSERSSGFGRVGGSSRSSGFGDFSSDRSNGFGHSESGKTSRSTRFGGFDDHDGDNKNTGRRFFHLLVLLRFGFKALFESDMTDSVGDEDCKDAN
ncbi:UNVERIFIED_CONTAM: DEAD-box ATP-dependent RNA helicase 53, mitochondrial [Sesamum calycinum]|uniref:DEAD-box ATP-dependent RNA helicase 53, mitochondrial n=1 Tax=Sesamum calycinum TaxID=2727403 RepID=A0AAW2MA50_9LAMI